MLKHILYSLTPLHLQGLCLIHIVEVSLLTLVSLLLLGNLSEGGELNCPYCRRLVRIPEEGFPVCRLTEYLKEQLALSPLGDDSFSVKPSKFKGILMVDTTPMYTVVLYQLN